MSVFYRNKWQPPINAGSVISTQTVGTHMHTIPRLEHATLY